MDASDGVLEGLGEGFHRIDVYLVRSNQVCWLVAGWKMCKPLDYLIQYVRNTVKDFTEATSILYGVVTRFFGWLEDVKPKSHGWMKKNGWNEAEKPDQAANHGEL